MVYLGPIIRLTPYERPSPTGYEPDRDLLIDKNLPQRLPPSSSSSERRGKRDRRQRDQKPLMEMRSGRDRRREKHIDIEV